MYLTTLYSLCGLVHVTAEVICIITTASAMSTAIARHGINIILRSGKIKSNPSLQRLSARPRCLPVSHINSVSPSLTGRRCSYLPVNEGEILLLQGGLPLSREPGEGVYWAVRVGMTALANNGTVGFAQAARRCVRDQKTLSPFLQSSPQMD